MYTVCSFILEVDPQIIAQRVAMRPDTEADGGTSGYGEHVRFHHQCCASILSFGDNEGCSQWLCWYGMHPIATKEPRRRSKSISMNTGCYADVLSSLGKCSSPACKVALELMSL